MHLSAQLPTLVCGIFREAYKPAGKPERIRSQNEFVDCVAEHLLQMRPVSPRDAAQAVFGVLERHPNPGEMDEIEQMLPEEIRALFATTRPDQTAVLLSCHPAVRT